MASLWTFVFLLGSLFVFGDAACPSIISREGWGARPPSGTPTKLPSQVGTAVIHHGGTATYCTTQAECASIIRAYQNYHMDTNGWDDIGYNFLVGEDGNIYEGRGWNNQGAHVTNWNSKSIGICIIGDFTSRAPNAAALNAAKALIQCGVELGRFPSAYQLVGHRQVGSTDCPGNSLYSNIQSWPRWTPNPTRASGEPILDDVLIELIMGKEAP